MDGTVIGDPLYQPGKAWQALAYDLDDTPTAGGAAASGDPAQAAMIAEGRAYWQRRADVAAARSGGRRPGA